MTGALPSGPGILPAHKSKLHDSEQHSTAQSNATRFQNAALSLCLFSTTQHGTIHAAYLAPARLVAGCDRCLLQGESVNRALDAGCPAIVSAAINSNEDAILFLAVRGADVEKTCGDHTTALMHAARRGDIGAARALVSVGADVEHEVASSHWTALTYATTNGQIEVIM